VNNTIQLLLLFLIKNIVYYKDNSIFVNLDKILKYNLVSFNAFYFVINIF